MTFLKGIKLVTFDATNTLLKFRVPPWEYYGSIAQKYGYNGTIDAIEVNLKKSYSEMDKKYPNFGKDSLSWYEWWSRVVNMTLRDGLPKDADIDAIAFELINQYKTQKCWRLADGSNELIHYLFKSGITIGIISNSDPRLYKILQNFNFYNNLKFIATSYDIGISKPDKGIFEYAQKKCGQVLPRECLHIGDDIIKDYKGALAAGWHSFLVTENENSTLIDSKHVFKQLNHIHDAFLAINFCNCED